MLMSSSSMMMGVSPGPDGPPSAIVVTLNTDVVCGALETLPDRVTTDVAPLKTRLRMNFFVPKPCFYRLSAAPAL